MTPEEVATAMLAALAENAPAESPSVETVPPTGNALAGGAGGSPFSASVSGGGRWARATVDVPPASWEGAVRLARDQLGCDFFDWLSAVDELEHGYLLVAHLWSTAGRY